MILIKRIFNGKGFFMKLTIPEELRNSFDMLMKSVPKELQSDEQLKDTALVYLKIGGMNLARTYVEITKKYLHNDPLDTGIGVRFPKVVEPKTEDDSTDEDNEADENGENDEENGDTLENDDE
jgi:hypothetical protein